jgi:hypothetical protein
MKKSIAGQESSTSLKFYSKADLEIKKSSMEKLRETGVYLDVATQIIHLCAFDPYKPPYPTLIKLIL